MGHPPRENDEAETYHRRRGALFAAAVAAVALAAFRLRPYRIEIAGGSMRPTLEPGDWCVATAAARPRSGHVVVLERPDRPGLEVVKRLVRQQTLLDRPCDIEIVFDLFELAVQLGLA